jgi:hypothetical protein
MQENLSKEELEELRHILEDLPSEKRSKILAAFHSGRLMNFVALLDSIVSAFEKLGAIGSWINAVLKPILTGIGLIFVVYLLITGKLNLSDFWK